MGTPRQTAHPVATTGEKSTAVAPASEGMLALVTAATSFGVMALGVRIAAADLPGPQIAFFRFTGSLLLLLMIGGRSAIVPRSARFGRLVVRGLLGAAGITLQFIAIARAGASTATMLHSTYPILTGFLAIPLLGERLTARTAAALPIAVVGVAVVVGLGDPATKASELASGAIAGLCGSCFAAAAIIAARHLRRVETATLITTWFMAVGVIVTAPSLLLGLPPFSLRLVLALGATIVASLAGQWLMHHALGRVEAARAGLVLMGNVVAATLLEALWFGDPIAAHRVIGGVIVIAAVWLSTSSVRAPVADPDAE